MELVYNLDLEYPQAAMNHAQAGINVDRDVVDHVYTASLYDLVIKQWQEHLGLAGIRIGIPPEIFKKISLLSNPYHYAAVTADTALAVLLWSSGYPLGPSMPIAELSASGPTGSVGAAWVKLLEVSPADAAILEGNAEIATVLALMEQDVPLHWSPTVHSVFPAGFREEARSSMQDLIDSGLLTTLPGPARSTLILFVMEGISPWLCLPQHLQLRRGEDYRAAVAANLLEAVDCLIDTAARAAVAGSSGGTGSGGGMGVGSSGGTGRGSSSDSGVGSSGVSSGADVGVGGIGLVGEDVGENPGSVLLHPGAVFVIGSQRSRPGRLSGILGFVRRPVVMALLTTGVVVSAVIRCRGKPKLPGGIVRQIRRVLQLFGHGGDVVCRISAAIDGEETSVSDVV